MNQFIVQAVAPAMENTALENFEKEYLDLSMGLTELSFVTLEGSVLDKVKEVITAIRKWIKAFFSKARAEKQEEMLKTASKSMDADADVYREFFANSKDWLAGKDGIPDKMYILLHMIQTGSLQFILNYTVNTVGDVSGDIASVTVHRDSVNRLKHDILLNHGRVVEGLMTEPERIFDDLKFLLDNQTLVIQKCNVLLDAGTGMLDELSNSRPDENLAIGVKYASAIVSLAKDVLVITASNTKEIEAFFKRVDSEMEKAGLAKK